MNACNIAAVAQMLYAEVKHPLLPNSFECLIDSTKKPEDKFHSALYCVSERGQSPVRLALTTVAYGEIPALTRLIAATIIAHPEKVSEFLQMINELLHERKTKNREMIAYVSVAGLLRAYSVLVSLCAIFIPEKVIEVYLGDFLFDHQLYTMGGEVEGDLVNIVAAFVTVYEPAAIASLADSLANCIERDEVKLNSGASQFIDILTHRRISRLTALGKLRRIGSGFTK